jgi:hypothetical protein
VPRSNKICDRCEWSINLRCWYFNTNKDKWGKLFSRNWSWLLQGGAIVCPTIGEIRTEGKDALPVVSDLPTRIQMRSWLLNPPEPPFTIAIAESGQKHILFLAQEAYNRNRFPVQFELDTLYVDRVEFTRLLSAYESLMALDFSKTEIDSGEYRSDRLMKSFEQWSSLDPIIEIVRGSRLLMLISHVAQKLP